MSRPPTPLPAALARHPFRVGRDFAITSGRARASDLWTPTAGVRLPAGQHDVLSICEAHALTLPSSAAFSHTTVCDLVGLPLPHLITLGNVHVTVPASIRAPRRRGLIGHQAEFSESQVWRWHGLRLTIPERTFVDLATLLPLDDLVAVGDRLISRRAPFTTRARLEAAVHSRIGMRGFRRASAALALLNDGAESPKETECRLLLNRHGYSDLDTNLEIFSNRGHFIARVDLAIEALKIAIEYEGDHHRDRAQWQRDIARRRRIEAEGWIYIPVTQHDLNDPRAFLSALAAAIASRMR